MEDQNLYILLDIISKNGSMRRLARQGINYNEIAYQTQASIKRGLILYKDEKITLTEIGIEYHKRLEKLYKRTKKEEWIEKDKKSRIDKRDKDFIFVPRQNELTF